MPRYAFLGPAGTFSEEALRGLGLEDVEHVACASIADVFTTVERGRADAGIVPVENSVEGSVNATLDALAFDSSLTISGEYVLDVRLALIVAPGVGLRDITKVTSHPQPLGQCRKWLDRNLPGIEAEASNSTAEAVQHAIAEPGVAAIATSLAAELYGGEILAGSIEDFADNKTRFVIIGRTKMPRTGDDKTTLALFLHEDKPGALLMILSEFAYGAINLTKLQSRPTKLVLGEYMFFIDLEGHIDDPHVALALACLRLKLREVKVLGSYPRYQKS